MIYRNTREKVKEYEDCPYLNQSLLKVLAEDGIEAFIDKKDDLIRSDKYYDEKEHFVVGHAVDTIITFGQELFNEEYLISKMPKKPTPVEMSIIKQVFDLVTAGMVVEGENPDVYRPLALYPVQGLEAMDNHQYYMNRHWSKKKDATEADDTRFATMCKNSLPEKYWRELIAARGKQVLSDDEVSKIIGVVDGDGNRIKHGTASSLLEHPYSAWVFKEQEGIDLVYQFPCYFNEAAVWCKALIDLLRIDHNRRKVFVIDVKSTGYSILKFNRQIRDRRYDFQGSWYINAVRKCLGELSDLIGKDISGYEFADYAMIVESTVRPVTPLIFILTTAAERIGRFGDGKYRMGWTQALDLFKLWQDKHFSIEEMFSESKGIIFIEDDYSYNKIF